MIPRRAACVSARDVMHMPISVLVADDHELVRRGVRALLESESGFTVAGEVADGREIVPAVERLKPDVLVLDLMMPGLSGLDVLRTLTPRGLATRVVVLSMYAGEAYAAQAFENGASAYVVKDAGGAELLAALRAAASGRRFLSAPLSESGIRAYAWRLATAPKDPFETLSAREREVLDLAVKGLTNSEIGIRLSISRRTAETHRSNLLRKLGLKGEKDLLRYALRRGLLDLDSGV
jgi:two-component system, NarL family, response regulator NreC